MNFTNRQAQFPGKKKLVMVDENNIPLPNEPPVLINIVKDEGNVTNEGTPISAENLNKGNWRDDNSLSFIARSDDGLPPAEDFKTQIVTKSDGGTWVIPPIGRGNPMQISSSYNTIIKVNGIAHDEISFSSDPQMQINDTKNATDNILSKISGIASGAQVNVKSDWNQTDVHADDYIKNKPTVKQISNAEVTWSTAGAIQDYPYCGTISIADVDDTMIPVALFADADTKSGRFSTKIETFNGGVYIWSKTDDSYYLANLVILKGV